MNKGRVDEIALRVWANTPTYATCDARKLEILAFTHALLAELAKVSEPVGFIAHNPGGFYEGSHIPAAPYDYAKFHNGLPTAGTKIFTHPPAPSAMEPQSAEIAKYKSLCDQMGEALNDAATSLETIAMRSYGDESYLNTMHQVRGYASSRASVARKDLEAWRAMK